MIQHPIWVTDPGHLGTIPEGKFFSLTILAYDPQFPSDIEKISYEIIAGSLPFGLQLASSGLLEGIPESTTILSGLPFEVAIDTDSKFAVRAIDSDGLISDRTFNLTITGQDAPQFITPAGSVGLFIEGQEINTKYTTKNRTTIDKKHFEPVIQGLYDVYNSGTAQFLKVPGIEICGKTGTAENFAIIDGKRTQLTDHSIFIAFAPKDNPKIALAVFVENGYYGARWAGRIASLMIEKYLKGEVTLKQMEKLVLEKSLEEEYAKPHSGKPFKINY